jgi:hypothetical protein
MKKILTGIAFILYAILWMMPYKEFTIFVFAYQTIAIIGLILVFIGGSEEE